jgi:hypothetical protein
VPGYNDDLIRLVDQRIRAALVTTRAVGTVVDRATSGFTCSVVLDGSTVAVPAKMFGWSRLEENDRVALMMFGSDWVVVGSYDDRGLGEASRRGAFAPNTTTSASYVDADSSAVVTFTKVKDATALRMILDATLWTTAINTEAEIGLRVSDGASFNVDYTLASLYINPAGQHVQLAGISHAIGVPAATYTISLRWRRAQGTGTLTVGTDDIYCMMAEEIRRAG